MTLQIVSKGVQPPWRKIPARNHRRWHQAKREIFEKISVGAPTSSTKREAAETLTSSTTGCARKRRSRERNSASGLPNTIGAEITPSKRRRGVRAPQSDTAYLAPAATCHPAQNAEGLTFHVSQTTFHSLPYCFRLRPNGVVFWTNRRASLPALLSRKSSGRRPAFRNNPRPAKLPNTPQSFLSAKAPVLRGFFISSESRNQESPGSNPGGATLGKEADSMPRVTTTCGISIALRSG